MTKSYHFRIGPADYQRFREMATIENELSDQGYSLIAGVDEAGRGPLAGPVATAACILDPAKPIYGLNDSKKLTPKRRDYLFEQIKEQAVSYSVKLIPVETIESKNILGATKFGMEQAITELSVKPDIVLLDAIRLDDPENHLPAQRSLVHGDALANCIAAASILAKVTRDRFMIELALQYPQYGFEKHKGYATATHYAAIKQYGVTSEHRLSFLHKLKLGENNRNSTVRKGNSAECQVAKSLLARGYQLLSQNFWIRNFGEIDFIMQRGKRILFVEVKARFQDDYEQAGIDALNSEKQFRIKTLANYFLESRNLEFDEVIFMLAVAKLDSDQTLQKITFYDFS